MKKKHSKTFTRVWITFFILTVATAISAATVSHMYSDITLPDSASGPWPNLDSDMVDGLHASELIALLQQRVVGTCPSGSAIRAINEVGGVECEPVVCECEGGGSGLKATYTAYGSTLVYPRCYTDAACSSVFSQKALNAILFQEDEDSLQTFSGCYSMWYNPFTGEGGCGLSSTTGVKCGVGLTESCSQTGWSGEIPLYTCTCTE